MRDSCGFVCAGAETVEVASLGHDEGSWAVLGVIPCWVSQAWPLACAHTSADSENKLDVKSGQSSSGRAG